MTWRSGGVLEKTLFQVYLNGKKIGLIKSDQELYDLIDTEQAQLKEKYNVSKVYPPHGLKVTAIKTYDKRVIEARDIYNKIKNQAPFTIRISNNNKWWRRT